MTVTNKVSNKSLMTGITPVADVVDAPTIGTATDSGDGTTASVPFTASATGGAATSFTAVSTPSSITGSSATSPITVTGLADSTAYTFKVYSLPISLPLVRINRTIHLNRTANILLKTHSYVLVFPLQARDGKRRPKSTSRQRVD